MKYSYEFKIKAIELHRKGKWIDAPDSVSDLENFHGEIRKWVRIFDLCGPEALRHKAQDRKWTPEERPEPVLKVLAGNSCRPVAYGAGINNGQLYQWVRKCKIHGHDGLVELRKSRRPKVPDMSKKKDVKPQELTVSEKEELLRLRSENEYYKAEAEALKKEMASRHERWDAQPGAKKLLLPRNPRKKDIS